MVRFLFLWSEQHERWFFLALCRKFLPLISFPFLKETMPHSHNLQKRTHSVQALKMYAAWIVVNQFLLFRSQFSSVNQPEIDDACWRNGRGKLRRKEIPRGKEKNFPRSLPTFFSHHGKEIARGKSPKLTHPNLPFRW